MFETLEPQNLNKLIESKVRDFPAPEAFHTLKVQGFKNEGIKSLAKVGGKFPMPVFALVVNMPIQTCKGADSTPPVPRSFHFACQAFVEGSEFFQRLFQELWGVYLLPRAECQVGIQTEVYPDTLTCRRIGIGCGIVSYNIKPIRASSITKDLEIANVSLPLSMAVIQNISTDKRKLLFFWTPFFEGQTDGVSFRKFVARLELRRTIPAFAFKLRKSAKPLKKAVVGRIQADYHTVKGIARYPRPVVLGAFQQLRQVRLQPIPTRIFSKDAVISLFKPQEVVMHIAQVVKQIAQTQVLGMFAYLIFVGSQGLSHITSLTPNQGG